MLAVSLKLISMFIILDSDPYSIEVSGNYRISNIVFHSQR